MESQPWRPISNPISPIKPLQRPHQTPAASPWESPSFCLDIPPIWPWPLQVRPPQIESRFNYYREKTTWMSSAQCLIYSRYFVQVLSWIKLITQNYWESWLFQTRQRFAVWEIAFFKQTFSSSDYVIMISIITEFLYLRLLQYRGIQKLEITNSSWALP